MKVLVTGASGFIGRYVVAELRARARPVVAMVRPGSPDDPFNPGKDCEVLRCDLGEGALSLERRNIDCIVHLAAALAGTPAEQYRSTVDGTHLLLEAARRAGIRNLVAVSSLSVLDYLSLPPLALVHEQVPLAAIGPGLGLYATLKSKQERLCTAFATEAGNRVVILRPGLVYDAHRLIAAHAGILKGPIHLYVSHPGEVPTVGVGGLARAIANATERVPARVECIHIVDDALPSQQAYLAGLRARGLLPSKGVTVPWTMLYALARTCGAIGKLVNQSHRMPELLLPHSFAARMKPFRYSNTKARQLLDWTPGTRFQ